MKKPRKPLSSVSSGGVKTGMKDKKKDKEAHEPKFGEKRKGGKNER